MVRYNQPLHLVQRIRVERKPPFNDRICHLERKQIKDKNRLRNRNDQHNKNLRIDFKKGFKMVWPTKRLDHIAQNH